MSSFCEILNVTLISIFPVLTFAAMNMSIFLGRVMDRCGSKFGQKVDFGVPDRSGLSYVSTKIVYG
jgi:hypothetical protein